MRHTITQAQAKSLKGKKIFAVKKDGMIVTGKVIRVKGNELLLAPEGGKSAVSTKALIPLVLFDLLAVETLPYGGFPYGGYPGVHPYGGYAFGGYPYEVWI
jgi:hypothetical protein